MYIYSVCILSDFKENKNYVVSSSFNDVIKLWDFKGNLLRTVGKNKKNTYFLEVYYDKKTNEFYIINTNENDIRTYSFLTGELYQKYQLLMLILIYLAY